MRTYEQELHNRLMFGMSLQNKIKSRAGRASVDAEVTCTEG